MMAAPKNKKAASRRLKLVRRPLDWPSALIVLAAIFYLCLFGLAFNIYSEKTNTVSGQLPIGGVATGTNLTHSLDLRTALKGTYPSDPVTIVKDYGASNGIASKIFSFKVKADGLTEYGLLLQPATAAPAGGYPAIILCHGYNPPKKYSTTGAYLGDMQFYAEHGFAVFKPDYRGQGLSLNDGQADSAYYSMAYNTDVMSLITALGKTSYINKSKINLWGHSMGAYIALRAAVLSPEIKNLILLSGPVDSLTKMYLTYIPPSDVNNLNALKTRNDDFSKYGTPADNTAFWKYASPINLVGHLKARVQIHVGALDQTVPPEFSADLNAALNAAHIKHEYYVYPDGNHSLAAQRPELLPRTLQDLLSPAA